MIQSELFRNSGELKETSAELSLRQYGTETCAPGHYFRGVRDHYLLHLVLSGKGRFCVEGACSAVSAGSAFLITPGADNWYRADEQEPWKYYWIGFSGTQAGWLMRAAGFKDGRHVLPLKNVEALRSIIEEMPDWSDDRAVHMIAQGYLYLFIGLLVRENGGSYAKYSPVVADALDCIHAHYDQPLTVAALADRVGVSRTTLYRAFVRECGVAPQAYLVDFRLKASIARFSSADSLAEIAYGCGFPHYAHYAETFSVKYGESPAAYRKRLAARSEQAGHDDNV